MNFLGGNDIAHDITRSTHYITRSTRYITRSTRDNIFGRGSKGTDTKKASQKCEALRGFECD